MKILILSLIGIIILCPNVLSDNPEVPSEFTIDISNYTPNTGDIVTVTLTEIPYVTGSFNGFYVDVYYGTQEEKEETLPDLVDYILEDGFFIPSNIDDENADQYWTTFSFIPNKSGVITIETYAHRQYDVTSKIVEIDVLENVANTDNSTPSFETIYLLFALIITIGLIIIRKRLKS